MRQTETLTGIWLQRLATFSLVCIAWVFFRADSVSTAFSMLGRLFTGWSTPTTLVTPMVVFATLGMLGLQFLPHEPAVRIQNRVATLRPVAMGVALGAALLVITALGPQGVAPFIYFRF